jgi:hypothetical protein
MWFGFLVKLVRKCRLASKKNIKNSKKEERFIVQQLFDQWS